MPHDDPMLHRVKLPRWCRPVRPLNVALPIHVEQPRIDPKPTENHSSPLLSEFLSAVDPTVLGRNQSVHAKLPVLVQLHLAVDLFLPSLRIDRKACSTIARRETRVSSFLAPRRRRSRTLTTHPIGKIAGRDVSGRFHRSLFLDLKNALLHLLKND